MSFQLSHQPIEEKLPYNHDYTLKLSLGQPLALSTTINPFQHSSFSETQWDALTPMQQKNWLENEAQTWAASFIEVSWQR